MPYPRPHAPFSPVETLLMGTVAARALLDGVRMGLFDLMAQGPRTAEDLALALEVQAASLEAMLDMLVAHRILEAHGPGYANTPMADDFLVSTSPLYQDKALELQTRFNRMIQEDIPALLRGENTQRTHIDDGWSEPDTMAGTLQYALSGQLQDAVEVIAALPEFLSFRSMADIGGNHGQYSMALVDRNPDLASTLLDLPHVVEAARKRCAAEGYAGRIHCQGFDLLKDDLPEDAYDLVFASHVLYACHENLDGFLAKVRAALKPGGCFVSHHFTTEGGRSDRYRTTVEFVTRLSGYATHFLDRDRLNTALTTSGFTGLTHTLTGPQERNLLLVARKA